MEERKSRQGVAAREVRGVVEQEQSANMVQSGVQEHESGQHAAAREVPGVVECKSAQQAAAREEPAV